MTGAGRLLVLIGAAIALIGGAMWLLGRAGFKGLPGDVHYHGKHVQIYFPIVTCIVLSILLTLGVWLWRWLTHRS